MAVMKLNRFCCCLDLKIGIQIIGTLVLLGYIFVTGVPFSGNDQFCTDLYYDKCGNLTAGVKAVITFFNLLTILVIILMIYGSEKNFPALMMPMLIIYAGSIIWSYVSFLFASVMAFRKRGAGYGIMNLIIGSTATALLVYFWMVIYYRYREIKADRIPLDPRENHPLQP
ncbi:uncharacterized protein LOC130675020 [Microplitis mediator]|uniref:uncharacterized protein LOC130675020 n=1 Tax=Microplitis mediator TaxID=375433 RepID=UPI00255427B3|nr:uncharacterized protein LOC130675020 [Microplitis mediator]